MASDRKQFAQCYAKWEYLNRAGSSSAPDEEGITAIITSDFPFYKKASSENEQWVDEQDDQDRQDFDAEAEEYAQSLRSIGVKSELILGADAKDLIDVIQDPEISSIVTIGHGSISDIYLYGAESGLFDWRNASQATTHLKTGTFTQRQCGLLKRNLNVPLGLFVMQWPQSIRAATGKYFDPIEYPEHNQDIQAVFSTSYRISYDGLKQYLNSNNFLADN